MADFDPQYRFWSLDDGLKIVTEAGCVWDAEYAPTPTLVSSAPAGEEPSEAPGERTQAAA